jgi:hypothetical protein
MTLAPIILAMLLTSCGENPSETAAPEKVSLLPVFFVPRGEAPPTPEQKTNLMRHLKWCQERYAALLRGDTFRLAAETPETYQGERDSAFYKKQPQGAAPDFVGELLKSKRLNRVNCPYIFFIVVMSPEEDWIGGGARPLNGGNNLGGGLVEVTSYGMDHTPSVQATVRHEIGHSLGLLHADAYGQSMESGRSMMSYNPAHHTNGFEDSPTPGVFSPEDLRALSLNKRCLEKFRFDPRTDIPAGESISPEIVCLGPMDIPGQPDYVEKPEASPGENPQPQAQSEPQSMTEIRLKPRFRPLRAIGTTLRLR